ncbi:MAG TPA: trypsin-like peptidase domain-containing protein [Acidimicrobiales bacterium]|nr:trypsin-like peptidase domain-containing protein [Acidimicrobiales bacterium]
MPPEADAPGGDEDISGPLPPPEDRLWRHPSELAAGWSGDDWDHDTGPRPSYSLRRRRRATLMAVVLVGATLAATAGTLAGGRGVLRGDDAARSGATGDAFTGAGPTVRSASDSLSAATVELQVQGPGGVHRGCAVQLAGMAAGLLVTASSLLDGAEALWVVRGGSRRMATIVGRDAVTDVALIEAPVNPVPVAAAPRPAVGARLVPAGAPCDSGGVDEGGDTRAGSAVNLAGPPAVLGGFTVSRPGMSTGSPVADQLGRMVGLVAGSSGAGAVALDAAVVRGSAAELAASGHVGHGWLGLEVAPGPAPMAVSAVAAHGPAAVAGLEPGDSLDAVGGLRISGMADLWAAVRLRHPGERVVVVYSRDGHIRSATVVLGSMPAP